MMIQPSPGVTGNHRSQCSLATGSAYGSRPQLPVLTTAQQVHFGTNPNKTLRTRIQQWLQKDWERLSNLLNTDRQVLHRHGINADAVKVVASPGIQIGENEKVQLIAKALKAHELALVNEKLGNFSNRYKATSIQLENGIWETATNMEIARDTTLCGERSAITSVWNKALQTLAGSLKSDTELEQAREGLKVKTLAMATSNLGEHTTICTECENWLASHKYFTPQTRFVQLVKDPNNSLVLQVQTQQQMIPLLNSQQPSITQQPIASLPMRISDQARDVMRTRSIEPQKLVDLLEQARQCYQENRTAELSGKNSAAGVMFSNGQTESRPRFDWTKRWFEPPDLRAVAEGFRKLQAQHFDPLLRINAIAYYGEDPDTPPNRTLGYLAQPTRGGPDTLIAVIENNTVQVRTVHDYKPFTYISDFRQEKK
jgi:hypothetical protein